MKWDKYRGTIYSNSGGWEIGKGITMHGYSLFEEIHGKLSFFQVMILNTTGRLPEKRLADWVEAHWICMCFSDPRLWCNKAAAYAGQGRAFPTAAIAAGGLAGDSKIYGAGSAELIEPFFLKAIDDVLINKMSIEEFINKEAIKRGRLFAPGFTRPLATGDERVNAMQKYAEELGFKVGPHLTMVYDMQDYLIENYGESLNLSGYYAAFMLDQGYSPKEIIRVCSMSVTGGVYAAYAEYYDKPVNTFLPLRCDDIEFNGVEQRPVPKKA